MRLIQHANEIPFASLTRDDLIVSTIHLVDRATTVGERVKEASNINSSLMVLRQFCETRRENQSQGTSKMVPYCESKLTSYFESLFDGEGHIGSEEIQNALKFTELTKDVIELHHRFPR